MSESNRVNIVVSEEAVFNEPPVTPLNTELRFTSESLDHQKETAESEELRDDRQVQDLVEVGVGAQGDISTELSFGNNDDLMAAALGSSFGAFSGITVDQYALAVVAATTKVVRASGSWVTDGFTALQWVRLRGFSNPANNGLFRVVSATATDLTLGVGTGALVDEASNTGRVVQGLFGTSNVAGVNLDSSSVDNSFNRASGSFITDGFRVGQRVRTFGFLTPGNNGIFQITSVAALKIVVSSVLVTDAAAAGRAIWGDHVRDGVTKRSFLVERQYTDLGKFLSFRGLRVGKLSASITTRQIMKMVLSFMGTKGVSASATVMGGTTIANANKICAAGVNIASVKEGGTTLTQACSELSWDVEAGLQMVDTIESKEHSDIALGTTKITGKAKLYFAGLSYYDKFQNHTSSSFEYQVTDVDGNVYYVTFPTIKYSASPIGTPGKNQALYADMAWQAIHNDTFSCQMMVDRIPV